MGVDVVMMMVKMMLSLKFILKKLFLIVDGVELVMCEDDGGVIEDVKDEVVDVVEV